MQVETTNANTLKKLNHPFCNAVSEHRSLGRNAEYLVKKEEKTFNTFLNMERVYASHQVLLIAETLKRTRNKEQNHVREGLILSLASTGNWAAASNISRFAMYPEHGTVNALRAATVSRQPLSNP